MKLKAIQKKGDIPSIIFIVVALVFVGIVFLFTNHLMQNIFNSFGNAIAESDRYDNDTEAVVAIRSIESQNTRIWDYGFLFIALGSVAALALVGFSTRISAIFYWVYAVLAMLVMVVAVLLSNIWQEIAEEPAFSETIVNFPITNGLLGTYFPSFILFGIILTMILLFGKGNNEI